MKVIQEPEVGSHAPKAPSPLLCWPFGLAHSPITGAKVFTKELPVISSSQNLCLFL